MFGFKKKEKAVEKELKAVVTGVAKALEKVEDEVFSKGFLGDGISITPTDSKFYAPISGVLSSVFPTGHAYGIKGDDGVEVLVHIGIDTVKMEGKGFDIKVKQDDTVKQGDLLTRMSSL